MAEPTATSEPGAAQGPIDEEPCLPFGQYAIAFHIAAQWCGAGEMPTGGTTRFEQALKSYEDDMLLYAHRDEPPPFRSIVCAGPVDAVSVHFPPQLTYEAEGKRKLVRAAGANAKGRTRSFRVALGQTVFERSELAILTLALLPAAESADDSELNEYDLVKLVKVWEGGEDVVESSSLADGRFVSFAAGVDEGMTLHQLAERAFPGWRPLDYEATSCEEDVVTTARSGYRVGTVELEVPAKDWRDDLFRDIAALKRRREAPTDGARWDRAVAVGGILQGLLDFREIDADELADVFADVDVDAEDQTVRAFHKGTLVSLAAESGEEPRPSPIGIDPYLAVPNIVLLHDEQRLKTARLLEHDIARRQRIPLLPIRNWGERAAIDETENGLSRMAGLLAQRHPNVFHYSSERRLQKRGRQSRGLDDLETFIRLRMDDLSSVLESRVRRRDRSTTVLGIAVGVVTAFLVQQAIEGRPLWLVALAAGALFVVFLWLRDRLF